MKEHVIKALLLATMTTIVWQEFSTQTLSLSTAIASHFSMLLCWYDLSFNPTVVKRPTYLEYGISVGVIERR